MLASQLVDKYRYENCTVVALSDGGVVVGAQIAMQLHCVVTMLLTAPITLPREPDEVAEIGSDGDVTYNGLLSAGELEEMTSENMNYIEQQKLEKMSELHHLLGDGGIINRELLREHNVILVSDGLISGVSLDAAASFLKPIHISRLIVATPLATVPAVDRMHMLADEIHCLNVVENPISVDHYYDQHDVPSHAKVIEIIEKIILDWK